MQVLEDGSIKDFTESGYPLGYMLAPVERYRNISEDKQMHLGIKLLNAAAGRLPLKVHLNNI